MNLEKLIPSVDWAVLMPVIIVIATGVVALVIEMLRPKQNNNLIVGVSIVGLGAAAVSLVSQIPRPGGQTFANMILSDQLGLVLQLVLVAVCAVCFLFSEPYLREKRIPFAEFYPLALWSTAGGMLMVSTTNFLMLFLGLEVLSIALYCLAGMSRQEAKSEESALKYFLLGAFASAFLLLGIAFVYGASGTLDLSGLTEAISTGDPMAIRLSGIGLALLLVGLCFKAAFVPFHQWTPDVYQGAPTNVTAFMASASKVAAIGAVVRVLWFAHPLEDIWLPALWIVAILTMSVGNLAALVQKDVKRTLGYSSIAHAGYLLVGILAALHKPEAVSLDAVAFYLASYAAMTVGSLAVVSLTASSGDEGTRFQDVRGLWHKAPWAAGCMVVFVASLIGVPPTAGFFGKLLIVQGALEAGFLPLVVVLALNSAVSAYYYLGILHSVFVAEEGAQPTSTAKPSTGLNLACLVCVAGVLGLGILADPILRSLNMGAMGLPPGRAIRTEAGVSLDPALEERPVTWSVR